MKKNHQSFNPL